MEKIKIKYAIDKIYTSLINRGAIERLTNALDNVVNGRKVDKDVLFARLTEEMLDEINVIRVLQDKKPLTKRNIITFAGTINNHLTKHLKEYGSTRNIAEAAFEVLTDSRTLILPGDGRKDSKGTVLANKCSGYKFISSVVLGDTENNKTSLKSISPRSRAQIKNLSEKKRDFKG